MEIHRLRLPLALCLLLVDATCFASRGAVAPRDHAARKLPSRVNDFDTRGFYRFSRVSRSLPRLLKAFKGLQRLFDVAHVASGAWRSQICRSYAGFQERPEHRALLLGLLRGSGLPATPCGAAVGRGQDQSGGDHGRRGLRKRAPTIIFTSFILEF